MALEPRQTKPAGTYRQQDWFAHVGYRELVCFFLTNYLVDHVPYAMVRTVEDASEM